MVPGTEFGPRAECAVVGCGRVARCHFSGRWAMRWVVVGDDGCQAKGTVGVTERRLRCMKMPATLDSGGRAVILWRLGLQIVLFHSVSAYSNVRDVGD